MHSRFLIIHFREVPIIKSGSVERECNPNVLFSLFYYSSLQLSLFDSPWTLPLIINYISPHQIMFFNTFFTAVLLVTGTIAALVNHPQELIVFSPRIISPKAAVAWPMGSRQTVKWGECKIFVKIVLFIN